MGVKVPNFRASALTVIFEERSLESCLKVSHEHGVSLITFIEKKYGKVETELGKGAFSTVYKVGSVALKVFNQPQEFFPNRGEPLFCIREKPKLKKTFIDSHISYVIDVLGVKKNGSQIVLKDQLEAGDLMLAVVMPLEEGQDLIDYLNQNTLKEDQIRHFSLQLIAMLKTLGELKIMHRDFKIDNIRIYKDTLTLIDPGFAKEISEEDPPRSPKGSCPWSAPEVLFSKPYGPNAEIWSLGVVLWAIVERNDVALLYDFKALYQEYLAKYLGIFREIWLVSQPLEFLVSGKNQKALVEPYLEERGKGFIEEQHLQIPNGSWWNPFSWGGKSASSLSAIDGAEWGLENRGENDVLGALKSVKTSREYVKDHEVDFRKWITSLPVERLHKTALVGRFVSAYPKSFYKFLSNKGISFENASGELRDLICKCLVSDPSQRPSLSEIEKHPFFQNKSSAKKKS